MARPLQIRVQRLVAAAVLALSFAALVAADISELGQLSDLYSSPEQLASTSLLVVLDNSRHTQESCVHRLTEAQMRMVQAYGEFAQLKCVSRHQAPADLLAALGASDTATAVFIKQGVVLGSRRSFVTTAATNHVQLKAWFDENMRVDITIRNERNEALKLYWLNGASEMFTATLQPLEAFALQSFPSHSFVVRTAGDAAMVKAFQIAGPAEVVIPVDTCGADDADCSRADEHVQRMRERQDKVRLQQNAEQPSKLPKFTRDGYKKTRLPTPLYEKLLDYWRRNQHLKVREAWRVDDIHTNHWQADLFMLHLPQHLKQEVFDTTRPMLEEWASIPKLIPTSCYGIREYGNGSVLAEHVDRVETHAVSAILNIDQEVTEPWELTMLDHNGVLQKIIMEPGDVVYYESARCLHGRPTPFNGKYYANVFVHFKPAEGWNYKQDHYG
jgi:hypothetical protein